MKVDKIFRLGLLFIFVSFSFSSAYGQEDTLKIERSDNKVIIGGDLYYIHVVEKGHTLYSISKAYNVSQREIASENPNILLGLRPGQALKIPFSEKDLKQKPEKAKEKYTYHKVKKGETLYSLSKRYNVSEEAIKQYNPVLMDEELKARQTIKIPRTGKLKKLKKIEGKKISSKDTTIGKSLGIAEDENFIYHKVDKKETLYSISKEYEVSIEKIKELNPYLLKKELQFNSVIKIPADSEEESHVFAKEKAEELERLKDTVPAYYKINEQLLDRCDSSELFKNKTIHAALFLPFHIEKNAEKFYIDSSEVNEEGEKNYKKIRRSPYYIYPSSENFIEFYEGILLALDSIKNTGISVKLSVYDTKRDSFQVRSILYENDFSETDLIIGPVYKENFKIVSEFASDEKIHIISPFSKVTEQLSRNPYIIQIQPSRDAQLEKFASYISDYSNHNMVLVHTGDSLYYPEIEYFKNKVFSYISQDTSIADIRFKEVAFKDSLFYLEQAMNLKEKNIVIVPSRNEAFVTDVVTNLNTLAKKDYNIKLFGYSNWLNFRNLEIEYFYNLQLSLFTPFYVDYKNATVKNVIRKYRHKFKGEPTNYVYHGYDVGYYFFNLMYKFGNEFQSCMNAYRPELCHSHFQFFKRYYDTGIENISVYVLNYLPNLTIQRKLLQTF